MASWYPSRVKPFLGTFVQRHTEAAAQNISMSALFVCSDTTMINTFEVESKDINGVFTVNVYYKKSGNPIWKLWRPVKAYWLGWKFVLANFGSPDLVHLNIIWPAGLFVYSLKLFSGIKYIITEQWTGYMDNDGAYKRSSTVKKYFTKLIARNAEVVIPVSKTLQNAMEAYGVGLKFEVVNNVVDVSAFHPNPIANTNSKITFLHVSTTFDEQKNISGILKAIKMLADKRTDFVFRIVSEAEFSAHEKLAKDLGLLNQYVFFESAKQTKGIAEEMRNAHCFVLFSNYETFGVVIVEAFASGLPIIASKAGGVLEQLTDEFGLFVEPRDINGLCQAMDTMIDTKDKYDAVKIRNYAIENFSYEAVGRKLNGIYSAVIN